MTDARRGEHDTNAARPAAARGRVVDYDADARDGRVTERVTIILLDRWPAGTVDVVVAPAGALAGRTDAELHNAYAAAYVGEPPRTRAPNATRAVYDLGRADALAECRAELREALDEERHKFNAKLAALENELAIARAGQGAP